MELKPCPFCGKQPTTRWNYSEPHYEEGYNIDCCCVHIIRIFKEEAIEVWNSRYSNQAIHPDSESSNNTKKCSTILIDELHPYLEG